MKSILITILLCFSISVFAGDWDLFQVDHKMHYFDNETQAFDWFLFEQSTQPNYIKSHKYSVFKGAAGCPIDSNYYNYFLKKSRWHMDSMVVLNHINRYSLATPSGSFEYDKMAEVGSSWPVIATDPLNDYDTILITCIAKELETFMGLTDSVKTFSFTPNGASPGQTPVSKFQLRVSKHYGVLEMVPFELLFHHPPNVDFLSFETIGIETPTVSVGYTPFKFEDYFHYQTGQILNWEFSEYLYNLKELYRDSITSVTYLPNGIEYTYDRRIFNVVDQTSSYLNNQIWEIDFKDRRAYGAPHGWGDFQGKSLDTSILQMFSNTQYYGPDQYTGDTVRQTTLSATSLLLDKSICTQYLILHYKDYYTYDSRYGMIEHCYKNFFGFFVERLVIPGPCPGVDSSLSCFDLPPNIDCDNGGISNRQECLQGTDPFDPADDIIITLPIELTTFTGTMEDHGAALNWRTATELNSAFFEVERSTDGINFREIGTVQAAGTTNQSIGYQFTDDLPPTGWLYYRLKMVDEDDGFTYSDVIALKNNKLSLQVELFPNPVKAGSFLQLITDTDMSTDGFIQVFDNLGKEVLTQQLPFKARRHKIDLGELSPGVYFVNLSIDGEEESRKVVVF